MKIDFTTFTLESLSSANFQEVYQFYCQNATFFPLSEPFFRRGTIADEGFDPTLSIFLRSPQNYQPIAMIIAVIRKGIISGKNCFIKVFIVEKNLRRQGIGSYLLAEVIKNMKRKVPWGSFLRYGDSIPRYWQPGVDLRHTSLLFFFQKHGFRQHHLRQNLSLPIQTPMAQPLTEKNEYLLMRARLKDRQNTVEFVQKQFSLGTWAQECAMSFENQPPTTFIAKDHQGTIVGFATHSAHYPGSFGPTGVLANMRKRGLGIGGELLRWCIWDMQQQGLQSADILWVVGATVKFYSKSVGAYISTVFRPMSRRIF